MLLLKNPIQNYAWGSSTAMAQFLGREPSGQPEAELWIGAHPSAPSLLNDGRSLLQAIQQRPAQLLGEAVHMRYPAQLPFLLKILAVAAPLSLQAHPNLRQAKAGFEREQNEGIELGAATRTFRDANHKPELLCALTPFEALAGFRAPNLTVKLLERLGVHGKRLAAKLKSGEPDALKNLFSELMNLPERDSSTLLVNLLKNCARQQEVAGPYQASFRCATQLAAQHPGDIGAIVSLLLNHIRLEPLQALYLEAGQLHCYLNGVGVEIMANSDNVVRGGLTRKNVDTEQLMQILNFESPPVSPAEQEATSTGEVVYRCPASEFQLSRIDLGWGASFSLKAEGPQILLCTEGRAELAGGGTAGRVLEKGQAGFLPSGTAAKLQGSGRFFRASVGAPAD